MTHRLAGRVGQQVLLRHIGDVLGFGVLGKQVVERLVLARPGVGRNSLIPLLGVVELRVDVENDATALCWPAFFGRPEVTRVLRDAGTDLQQRNKHGLTPLDCALGGSQGRWQRFSNATLEDWRQCVALLHS